MIEIVVYLGLFAILIGGAIATAYNVFENASRNQTKAFLQQEGDFMIGKIEWALGGIQAVNTPTTVGSILSVNKWDASIGTVVIDMDPVTAVDMRLTRGSGTPVALNSAEVTVSSLQFTHTYSSASNPESVAASFTLSGKMENGMTVTEDFSTTKYLRR